MWEASDDLHAFASVLPLGKHWQSRCLTATDNWQRSAIVRLSKLIGSKQVASIGVGSPGRLCIAHLFPRTRKRPEDVSLSTDKLCSDDLFVVLASSSIASGVVLVSSHVRSVTAQDAQPTFKTLTFTAADVLLCNSRTAGREVGQPGSSSSPNSASATPQNKSSKVF